MTPSQRIGYINYRFARGLYNVTLCIWFVVYACFVTCIIL